MQSFRSELENLQNPVVARDIIDLEKKIRLYREGKIDDDKFRSLRLVRGIYGQRQPGVQMVRIKIPLGRISTRQIRTIADISDQYASSNLHATTRQDIQIHFVSLDKTPELWANLEKEGITTREACGNTVRNITASHLAGIDPDEPFDVSPHAHAMFEYFLRNPVCQEMGRKFKIAFSSSNQDTAFTFIHDLGFIPRIDNGKKGFKVLIGGGLGANPYLAQTAYEFLDEDKIIPFTESLLRVFDRYGERNRRMKARFKFLLDELGLEKIMALVEEEQRALKYKRYSQFSGVFDNDLAAPTISQEEVVFHDQGKYQRWIDTNVIKQKQNGYFAVYVKLPLGNMSSDLARAFADVVDRFTKAELRITINQGYLIRFVARDALPFVYHGLDALGLAEPGFDSVGDITACPGTDSCNLGISDSTNTALALEKVIREEYPDLIYNQDIKIKISGCPNSCGQHGLASIGFHGSTIKTKDGNVLPALVVLLGGGRTGNGNGVISDKVIKIPSKRGPRALRILLDDYECNALDGEYYHNYYNRTGRNYFYSLLKPLTDLSTVVPDEFVDWGADENFVLHTAVGECAGVIIDLVATLFNDSAEKIEWANETLQARQYADSIYHSYNAFVNTAKALLLTRDIRPSTQLQVLQEFQKTFVDSEQITLFLDFPAHVLSVNKEEPASEFAVRYLDDARHFLSNVIRYHTREKQTIQS